MKEVKSRTGPMLIVCPNCSTSYTVEPASLGAGGRTVRCARCRTVWFASLGRGSPEPSHAEAFVDGAIAEAEAESGGAAGEMSIGAGVQPPAHPTDDFSEQYGEEAGLRSARTLPEEPGPEPVAMEHAPSLVPPLEHVAEQADEPEPDAEEDVESYAARRQRMQAHRKKARSSSRWTAVVLVLFALNVALVGARNDVVRYLPQTASLFAAIGLPVNLRHLRFDNVRISRERQDGVNVLVVEGTIVSTADKPVPVPRLRFAARDAAGQEIYTWTALPARSVLKPGEHLDFRSRLASPPADAKNVMVRFFTGRDAAAAAAK